MLVEFRVANYRSIGEEQVLSLRPDSKKGDGDNNLVVDGKYSALNALALYGANASGKSNLLLSMSLLDSLLHLSARASSTTKLPYDPFLLREGWDQKPTKFEITFLVQGVKYRYGVEYSLDVIEREWLYKKSVGREVNIFLRVGETIDPTIALKGNAKIIDAAIEATRANSLFLSTCDMFNIEEARIVFQWFRNFKMIDGLNSASEEMETVSLWQHGNQEFRDRINAFLGRMNLGLTAIEVTTKDFDASELPELLDENTRRALIGRLTGKMSYSVQAQHKLYSASGDETKAHLHWKLDERESAGTIKAFHLSGPILWALENGGVLIIDEIEAKLHPIMTLDTISLFLNPDTNPNHAQLIFATHDTNLLSYSNLRRDQIYFAEKNQWESTEIYSLSDFVYVDQKGDGSTKRERPDTDKEKRYIEGRYGAIPILSSFHAVTSPSDG